MYHFKVFVMTGLGIEPETICTPGEHSTTGPSGAVVTIMEFSYHFEGVAIFYPINRDNPLQMVDGKQDF